MNATVNVAIDQAIDGLARVHFATDPLLPLTVSQACSIADSAKKRHGKIIEAALLAGLGTSSRYEVWAPRRFRIPDQADTIASLQASGAKMSQIECQYSGLGRDVQIDMMACDREQRTLRAYEIKRGHGRHDAGKIRSMLRDLRCVEAVLTSFGAGIGKDVRLVEAHILFWYGQLSGIPRPWAISGNETDQHFGCSIWAFVEDATAVFRARLLTLIETGKSPPAAPGQSTLGLDGGSDA